MLVAVCADRSLRLIGAVGWPAQADYYRGCGPGPAGLAVGSAGAGCMEQVASSNAGLQTDIDDMKVQVHLRRSDETDWNQATVRLLDFGRVPMVGEYVALEPHYQTWNCVELVVHNAYEGQHIAEVYCVIYEAAEVLQAQLES